MVTHLCEWLTRYGEYCENFSMVNIVNLDVHKAFIIMNRYAEYCEKFGMVWLIL